VGLAVARALEQSEHRIRAKVIERSRTCAERAADALERTIVLNGDGMDSSLLQEANIERADAVLCVTDDDKVNLLAALDIDAYISPRATTVSSILRHIRHGRVRGVYSIGDAEAEVIEAQVLSTSSIAGKLIRDVDFPEGALVGAIKRGSEVIRPRGTTRIVEGDLVMIFAMSDDVPEVERLLQVSIDFF
jgi:trk system potassium uptake protein TrkA